ncbi:MAG TPA: LysR family transcriptional regulator, partial [Alicycliphilus sp.]|nr:LysR family transcriptional regulator [Alicycliphilus sp.]
RHARLRQLLLALQHSGSVMKAAQHLDMSQSAATQALAELERVLDQRLFERHARGMRPTPAGQALTDAAGGVMSELEDACETLAAIRLGASAALRLGAIPAAAHTILAPLLAQFYGQRPQVHVDVQEGEGAQLLALLLSGALDAVFCRQPALLPETFVFTPLLADETVFIAAPSHPLAGARQVLLQQLADARWVLPTSSIAVRDVFERLVLAQLPQAQWFPVSTVSLPVLKGLLAQPGAVTLVPRSILPALYHGGPAAGGCLLDMRVDARLLALAPLGVAHRREAAPTLLREMLQPWPAAGG